MGNSSGKRKVVASYKVESYKAGIDSNQSGQKKNPLFMRRAGFPLGGMLRGLGFMGKMNSEGNHRSILDYGR